MNTVVLCSHVPDPRMNKRIRSLSEISENISVLYWGRTFSNIYKIDDFVGIKTNRLSSRKQTHLLSRLIENKRLNLKSCNILNEIKPDLLYISGIECLPVAKRINNSSVCKTIIEIPDLPAMSHIEKYGLFSPLLETWVNRRIMIADLVVLTSPYFYSEYYKVKTQITEDQVFVFENVPEEDVFAKVTKRPNKALRIGFIGSVRYFESIRTLFEAAKGIKEVEVVISGKGPDYERVLQLSRSYDNVLITGEYSYREDIADLYSAVDLVYSVYDTKHLNVRLALPNRLYEAIVSGTPVIVAKGTCLEHYVRQLGVGLSVTFGRVNELRSLIMELIRENNNVLKRISEREIEIRNNYFYENAEQKFLEWILRKLER